MWMQKKKKKKKIHGIAQVYVGFFWGGGTNKTNSFFLIYGLEVNILG